MCITSMEFLLDLNYLENKKNKKDKTLALVGTQTQGD